MPTIDELIIDAKATLAKHIADGPDWYESIDGYEADGVTKSYDVDAVVDWEDITELLQDELEMLEQRKRDIDSGAISDGIGEFDDSPFKSNYPKDVHPGTGQITQAIADEKNPAHPSNYDGLYGISDYHDLVPEKPVSTHTNSIKANQLHELASYSTQYDLYMMKFDDYNYVQDTLLNGGDSLKNLAMDFTGKPERLLISSSGIQREAREGTSTNSPHFTRDYYIKDIEIESYIAPNKNTG